MEDPAESLIVCTNHFGVSELGFYALIVLAIYAIVANSVVIFLLLKIPFHPMVKVFSLCERIFVLCQCSVVEILRSVFYYTSCQPNWTNIFPKVWFNRNGDLVHILLTKDTYYLNRNMLVDSAYMMPSLNCAVLEKPSLLLNTGAIVFFTMTCFLRYYLIVKNLGSLNHDTLTDSSQITKLTILGFLVTCALTALTFDDQYTFSRACLTPNLPQPPARLSKVIYFLILHLNNFGLLILHIIMIIKITKISSQVQSQVNECLYILDYFTQPTI